YHFSTVYPRYIAYMVKMGIKDPDLLFGFLIFKQPISTYPVIGSIPAFGWPFRSFRKPEGMLLYYPVFIAVIKNSRVFALVASFTAYPNVIVTCKISLKVLHLLWQC